MNCCHRHDCADIHCPGRVTYDSDGITVTEHCCDPAWSWIDSMQPAAVWALALAVCLFSWALVAGLIVYFT